MGKIEKGGYYVIYFSRVLVIKNKISRKLCLYFTDWKKKVKSNVFEH